MNTEPSSDSPATLPASDRDSLLAQGYEVVGFVSLDEEYLFRPDTQQLAYLRYWPSYTAIIIKQTERAEVLGVTIAANRYLAPLDGGAFRRARETASRWFPDYDME